MDISLDDIFAFVFKPVVRKDLGEFSLNSNMLTVLMDLDGKQNLGDIAQKTGLSKGAMREVASKLWQLKLIEPVEGAISMLDEDFFDYLRAQLSLAVGPIAEVIVDDAIADLNHSPYQFPSHRAAELVDLLAREIQREEKQRTFKQNMVNKIKEKGY